MRRSKHDFLSTFDLEYREKYEKSMTKLKKLRGLRDIAVKKTIIKCYPFLVPLQLFLTWHIKTPKSLVFSGGALLGILFFYILTEIIFKMQTNVKS
jgi:hypothetical protein